MAEAGSWDVVFHGSHQSQAYRLARMFQRGPTEWKVFPPDFATACTELGPRTDHKGPNLVLFENVGLDQGALMEWFSKSFLRRHFTRIYWLDPRVPAVSSREELLSAIIAHGPPEGDGGVLRLLCTPKPVQQYLQDHLPLNFELHPVNYTHVLSVVEADGWLRWSYMPAQWLYKQRPDEPSFLTDAVAHAVNKVDEALQLVYGDLSHSKAVNKVDEALQLVYGDLTHSKSSGAFKCAIDLGAAPGAWTMYLAALSE
eukprot:gene15237-21319_t